MTCLIPDGNGDWLAAAAKAVRDGQVLALPYERLFGLAVNALDPAAVAKVAAIKGRTGQGEGKPIAIILPDQGAAAWVTDRFSPEAAALAARYWPGPLTLVVTARPGLPAPLMSPTGHIGIRVAGRSAAAALAAAAGVALTATSANLPGAQDARSHRDVMGLAGVDIVVEGEVAGPPGSTVVDVSSGAPRLLRQGVVQLPELSR